MNMTVATNGDSNVDKIQVILNVLKKQINQYAFKEETMKSKEESTRNQRIVKLMMEAKRLSSQIQKIRKDIRRYEKKYEKALKRKVKRIKMQIKEDTLKLDGLKQRYKELDPKVTVQPSTMKKEAQRSLKILSRPLGIRGRVHKSKLKQRSAPIHRKIKIKIKKNEKLGRREMLFVNDDYAQQPIAELTKSVEPPSTLNSRECRITLHRLTEEQMGRYIGQIRLGQQQTKRKQILRKISRESPKPVDGSQSTEATPKWHIKIPKSVLEESQKVDQSPKSNASSSAKNVTQASYVRSMHTYQFRDGSVPSV